MKQVDPATIIDNITGFMIYFVPGYIFWTVYNFVAVRPREGTPEYLIIKSIAASFILNISLQRLEVITRWTYLNQYYSMILVAAAVFWGALCGAFRKSEKLAKNASSILKHDFDDDLFFRLWRDTKKATVVGVILRNQETKQIIIGQLLRVQEYFKREPVITLAFYQILDNNGSTIIENYEGVEGIEISIRYTASWIIETVKVER